MANGPGTFTVFILVFGFWGLIDAFKGIFDGDYRASKGKDFLHYFWKFIGCLLCLLIGLLFTYLEITEGLG